jgi:hypothetical protein
MALTERQQKKLIKGMIRTFTDNFSRWDLDTVYGKSGDLSFSEYMVEY